MVAGHLEFVRDSSGTGVLYDQPWNREREDLQYYIDDERVFIATGGCDGWLRLSLS